MHKRIVVISDLHSGHILGLTPPAWDADSPDRRAEYLKKAFKQRRHIWDFYSATLKDLRPIHALIVNGDAIDGSGERQAGREMLVVDKNDQCEVAAECIKEARAKNVLLTYGTGAHTGKDVDFGKNIAKFVEAAKGEGVGGLLWHEVLGAS